MELHQKKLINYTTNIIEYIAEDQNIDSDEITPNITAIGIVLRLKKMQA